jgi:hypothetical protein
MERIIGVARGRSHRERLIAAVGKIRFEVSGGADRG